MIDDSRSEVSSKKSFSRRRRRVRARKQLPTADWAAARPCRRGGCQATSASSRPFRSRLVAWWKTSTPTSWFYTLPRRAKRGLWFKLHFGCDGLHIDFGYRIAISQNSHVRVFVNTPRATVRQRSRGRTKFAIVIRQLFSRPDESSVSRLTVCFRRRVDPP